MSRGFKGNDPNKVPLGDRRPWPSSTSSGRESGGMLGGGGSLLNPSYLAGREREARGESPSSSHGHNSGSGGNGNNSYASIPSKFSQEFQSRWSSMNPEYGDHQHHQQHHHSSSSMSMSLSRPSGFESERGVKRVQLNQPEYEFDSNSNSQELSEADSRELRRKKRKSRWAGTENEKAVIPGMPTMLPPNLTADQEDAYIAQLQIEELTRKLRTGDLGIPANLEARSPSPEPIYGTDGKRLNTREYRTRKKLEEERHKLIQKLMAINPEYKPPADYRAPMIKIVDRVSIPQEEHPEINFVGLLIGPRGNTLKGLEKDSGAKIIIRGKGSVKEGKVGGKAGGGHPLPGEDEPLHAYVTSNNPESVKRACEKIKDIIRQGIDMPESQNDLRKMQLRELALLNGTLREGEGPKCSNCGATSHRTWHCPDKPNITNSVVCTVCGSAGHISKDCKSKRPGEGGVPGTGGNKAKYDEEYMSLMAELGEGEPPPRHDHESGGGGGRWKPSSSRLFENKGPMRALMSSSSSGSSGGGPSHSHSSSHSHHSNNRDRGDHHRDRETTQVLRNPPPPPPSSSSSSNNGKGHSQQSRYQHPPPPSSRWGGNVPPPPGVSHSQPAPPGSEGNTHSTNAPPTSQWSSAGYYPPPPMPPYNQWGGGGNSSGAAAAAAAPPPPMFWQNYAPPPPPPPAPPRGAPPPPPPPPPGGS